MAVERKLYCFIPLVFYVAIVQGNACNWFKATEALLDTHFHKQSLRALKTFYYTNNKTNLVKAGYFFYYLTLLAKINIETEYFGLG